MQLKVAVSNKVSFGKYFIGYKDDKKIRPLCLFPLKMSAYIEKTLIKLNIYLF